MDEPREHYAQWSKSEKDKYYMIALKCGIENISESMYKTETDPQTEKRLMATKEGGRGHIWSEINRYKLSYIKQISNKNLLCNTVNYTQYLVITYKRI